MAYSRYEDRDITNNKLELYRHLFDERGMNFIRQYTTPDFKYPTPFEFSQLDIKYVVWKVGDRYWKIAEREYGNPELWWVIAWFNKKPTEAHLTLGEKVLVPKPLDRVFRLLGL